MHNYIKTLEKKFDIEIVRSSQHLRGEDYFDLDKEGKIFKLYLCGIDMQSLDVLLPIADQLVELAVSDCNIKSLASLKAFPNLEVLDLSSNPLETSTLKNLNFLPKLKGLDVSDGIFTDTSYLGELIQLEELYIGGSDRLYEIKGLEQLKNLKHLDIERSLIDSIEKIQVHENLRSLHFTSADVTKLSYFNRFPNLEELRMGGNPEIKKMEGLKELQNLKQLLIRGTNIKEIEGLEQLTNLEVLDLSANEISEVRGIGHLTKLRELNLNENHITKVENLEGLINLELLLLEANNLKSFDTTFLQHLDSECHIYMRGFEQADNIAAIAPKHVKINLDEDFDYPTKLIWSKELFE